MGIAYPKESNEQDVKTLLERLPVVDKIPHYRERDGAKVMKHNDSVQKKFHMSDNQQEMVLVEKQIIVKKVMHGNKFHNGAKTSRHAHGRIRKQHNKKTVQVLFSFDTTGSMYPYLNQVKQA